MRGLDPDGVATDEWIEADWSVFGTDEDPVVRAALAWLGQHEACVSAGAAHWLPWE